MVNNKIAEAIPQGKTRVEVARESGISRECLYLVMDGTNVPTVETALRIAKVLNRTVEDLYELLDGPRGDVRKLRRRAKEALAPGRGTGGGNCTRIPQGGIAQTKLTAARP